MKLTRNLHRRNRCHSCDAPASIRFRRRNWCEPCFERDENQPLPDRIENHLRTHSPTAELEAHAQNLRGLSNR